MQILENFGDNTKTPFRLSYISVIDQLIVFSFLMFVVEALSTLKSLT